MATACTFLASKVTEQSVRVKEIANRFLEIKRSKLPNVSMLSSITEEMIQKTAKDVIFHEFHLLAVLDYQLQVSLPYTDIVSIVSHGGGSQNLVKLAFNFANDCFFSRIPLWRTSEEIASVCVFFAASFLQVQVDLQINPQVLNEFLEVYESVSNN
jgi:hypothetical protein